MSHTILVVDDTKFMRKMLTDMLKQFGYQVVGEADNGRQAVQKFNELRPDVVMMDITMPEMDGIEAMREIRRIDPASIVLICSAMSQQDLISDALKAGANGYVMKPFKPNRVNEVIRKNVTPKIQVVKPAAVAEAVIREPVQAPEEVAEQTEELVLQEPEIIAAEIPAEAAEPPQEQPVEQPTEQPADEPLAALADAGTPAEEETLLEESETAEIILPAAAELASAEVEDRPAAEEPAASDPDTSQLVPEEPDAAEMEPQEPDPDEEVWSLDDLNELSLIMDDLEESEISSLSEFVNMGASAGIKESKQEDMSHKIIPIIRGGTNVKKFTSSYMCNWSEDINGGVLSYLVICTESENRVCLEVTNEKQEKQKVEISLEGFKQLMSWMEDKLSTGSNVRDLSRKSEM